MNQLMKQATHLVKPSRQSYTKEVSLEIIPFSDWKSREITKVYGLSFKEEFPVGGWRGGEEIPKGGWRGGEEIPSGGWRGGEEIPTGGWRGGEEIPKGGWRAVEEIPAGGWRGGEEIPKGGWRGGEEIPKGGWRGGEEIPKGGWRAKEDVYRTNDGGGYFKFRFYPIGDYYEIDILAMPSYGSRSSDMHSTHRLPSGRGGYKICFGDPRILRDLNTAKKWAAVWSEYTNRYIKYGNAFPNS